MRVLGLDLGTRTLGVAISDKLNLIASPLTVIKFTDYKEIWPELDKIIKDNEVTTLVLGLPKNMNNSEGFAAARSKGFRKALKDRYQMEAIMIDERLSTREAENILISGNMRRVKRKKVIDGVAATIILENYLNRKDK